MKSKYFKAELKHRGVVRIPLLLLAIVQTMTLKDSFAYLIHTHVRQKFSSRDTSILSDLV